MLGGSRIKNFFLRAFKSYSLLNNFIDNKYDQPQKILFICFFLFFTIPLLSMFARDYFTETAYVEKLIRTNQESLNKIVRDYDKILQNLAKRVEDKDTYKDEQKIIEQLKGIEQLKKFSKDSHIQNLMGLRWIGINKRVLGPYGIIQTLSLKDFSHVFKLLAKVPQSTLIFRVNGKFYSGIGIGKAENILGFLIIPLRIPIGLIAAETNQLSLLNVKVTLIENDSKTSKEIISIIPNYKIKIFEYLGERYISIGIIFLTAGLLCLLMSLLGLKSRRKIKELEEINKAYTDNLLSFQEASSIVINKYQKVTENNKEITKFLLEARKGGSSNLLSETEENKLIEKLYINNNPFYGRDSYNNDAKGIDIIPILKHCINIKLYEIKTHKIKFHFEINSQSVILFGEAFQFYSLFLKILSLSLLRTPEGGCTWVKVKSAPHNKDSVLSIIFEDNGFAFSDEKIKQLADSPKEMGLVSSELDWYKTTQLAQALNFEFSIRTKNKNINLIALTYLNKNIKESDRIEYVSPGNVIPFRKE